MANSIETVETVAIMDSNTNPPKPVVVLTTSIDK